MRKRTNRFLLLPMIAALLLLAGIPLSAQTPVLGLAGTEEYIDAFGTPYIRYRIPVTNWSAYPSAMFTEQLAPQNAEEEAWAGLNPMPCRTWVYIYDSADNSYIYGFIALGQPEDLMDIWFAKLPGVTPPAQVYVRLHDRVTGIDYTSGPLSVYAPAAPVANADSASTAEDTAVTVNVTANDTDINGDPLTVSAIAGGPAHGTAVPSGGSVIYTPAANYNGADSFTYTLSDGTYTATASVNITITSVGDAPAAPSGLLTDGAVDPNNVSRYAPQFSWSFADVDAGDHQTAYQIRIGTTPGSAAAWDSGKVSSTAAGAAFSGAELAPNTTYYWSVRVWDTYDLAGSWSASGSFVILDIGYRIFDGTETVRVATDYANSSTAIRIAKNGVIYGVLLVDPSDPSASSIRVMTPSGIKAYKKM